MSVLLKCDSSAAPGQPKTRLFTTNEIFQLLFVLPSSVSRNHMALFVFSIAQVHSRAYSHTHIHAHAARTRTRTHLEALLAVRLCNRD